MPDGALPNLVIVGAQKCGTSSLHHYLDLHPEVSMSWPKELDYFLAGPSKRYDLAWYAGHFDAAAACRGEASPNYTAYPRYRGVPQRMVAAIPDARLVMLVRDPVDRIAAQWMHNAAHGRVGAELAATLHDPRRTYVARSRYFLQLRRFLRLYPREQVLVLDQGDLRDRRAETLRSVFEFVGVDAGFTHPDFAAVHHATVRKRRPNRGGQVLQRARATAPGRVLPRRAWSRMRRTRLLSEPVQRPEGLREALGEEVLTALHADAQRLRRYTGRPFAHWSV